MAATIERRDGRNASDSRGRVVDQGSLTAFDGSCTWTQGATVVTAAISGPVAARAVNEDYRKATVQCLVKLNESENNCGGATKIIADRKKVAQQATETKLQQMVQKVLGSVIYLESFPRCSFNVTIHVLYNDGAVLSAIFNALMVALIDAQIPCRSSFSASSVAIMKTAGGLSVVADPTLDEENKSAASAFFVHSLPQCGGGVLASDTTMNAASNTGVNAIPFDTYVEVEKVTDSLCQGTFTYIRKALMKTMLDKKTKSDERRAAMMMNGNGNGSADDEKSKNLLRKGLVSAANAAEVLADVEGGQQGADQEIVDEEGDDDEIAFV